MHNIQRKIEKLLHSQENHDLSLRKIADLIKEDSSQPQKIKHHLMQLERKGILRFDLNERKLKKIIIAPASSQHFFSIPILGAANAGPATLFADNHLEGYLKVSKSIIKNKKIKGLFAIKAVGNSMNKANIEGKNIDNGDYLIVDGDFKNPDNNKYVVSVIEGQANVKKIMTDKANNQIILISESTEDNPPIYIHHDDFMDYMIAGTVIQVIKKPKS